MRIAYPKKVLLLAGLLVGGVIYFQLYALQRTFNSNQNFWSRVEQAIPRIRQIADARLTDFGYDINTLTSKVTLSGEAAEEAWTVSYSYPGNENLTRLNGDIEVYLNKHGEVKRVTKFDGDREQLIYGKDERLPAGLTQTEVINRIGEPDHRGRPPQDQLRFGDELWIYKKNSRRTVRVEVFFIDGKVTIVDHFG